MGRVKYETKADKVNEMAIMTAWSAVCNVLPVKVSDRKADSAVDFFCTRDGKLVGVAEVKDRRGWKPEYGTVILGVTKVAALSALSNSLSVPAVFIVQLPAGIYHVTIPQCVTWEVGQHGRTDRGDDADVELCYCIPILDFICAIPSG